MTKLDMTGIAVLCALGALAVSVAVAVAPDVRRYIKLKSM